MAPSWHIGPDGGEERAYEIFHRRREKKRIGAVVLVTVDGRHSTTLHKRKGKKRARHFQRGKFGKKKEKEEPGFWKRKKVPMTNHNSPWT